ncbi:alpha/beta hydrolase [Pseudomonas sp. SH10-3B]|jgi:predicted esterase|uniref:alpha/beta fold hydrolase n=1 Tax=Pseudomonas sp. SH10-3B TaxID=2816049 RepID=UPI001CA735A2|nr:alpha/beta fold hydrolase [Pseudomonas sp. SH10-3B]MBY8946710.1 alpha/beta hydrolase [Pseudomonas sp. SH10-3B]
MDSQLASLIERLANPTVLPMRPTESRQLAAMPTEVIDCGPYRSRVLIRENHEPRAKNALLLHGWGGHPLMLAEAQTLLQAQGYRVYAPFLLGHDPRTPASCDLPGQSALLLAMQARYGPFDSVVAHSAGGLITAMAHWLGFSFNRVALLAAPASVPSLLLHSLRQHRAPGHYLAPLSGYFQSRYGLPADVRAAQPYTFSGPRVLIMHGKQDRRISHTDAGHIHAQSADSQLHMIEDTGHLGILSHQRTRQALTRFLCAKNADHEKGNLHVGAY